MVESLLVFVNAILAKQFVSRRKQNASLKNLGEETLFSKILDWLLPAPCLFVNEQLRPSMNKLLGRAFSKNEESGWTFV